MRTAGRLNLSLTDTGRAVVTGTVFVALASLIVPAFGVLSALVSVIAVSLLVGIALRPRTRITGDAPERIIAGQTIGLNYTVKNVGRLPLYNLCVKSSAGPDAIEQIGAPQIIPRLGPEETAEVTVKIRTLRRGRWQVKYPTCQSSFPFNLFRFGASARDEHTLVVLPSFFKLQTGPRRPGRHVSAGSGRPAGRAGLSAEYAGNRPFLPGDSLRTIDVRAWARLSTPATREYHDDQDNSAALVLDTAVADGMRSRPESSEVREFEAAVSLCASVAFSINSNRLIDLLMVGDDLHELASQPRSARLDSAHDILAAVEPTADYPSSQTSETLAGRFAETSEVYFVLLQWNKAHRELLELAENAGCHCTVLIVAEPDAAHVEQISMEQNSNIRGGVTKRHHMLDLPREKSNNTHFFL